MKLREVERLRAVAILMVMVVHWGPLQKFLPPVARASWSGVDLFFVISGFVVSLSLVRMLPALEGEATFLGAFDRARDALQAFYVRRFFRILPPALAMMLGFLALSDVIPQKFGPRSTWPLEFLSFFGGVYNYVHPFHRNFRMGVLWSLAVEEHFYLLLPVLFVAFRTTRRRLGACAGLALFSIAARLLPWPDVGMEAPDFYAKISSHLRFDSLMAGVVLALLYGTRRGAPGTLPPWAWRGLVVPAAIALIASLPGILPERSMFREGFVALWALSGVLVALAGRDAGLVLPVPGLGRALEHLGSRSYALYLVHVGVGRFEDVVRHRSELYMRLVPDGDWPVARVLVCFAGSVLLAEAMHRGVERPCMRLGRRLLEARGPARASSA